MPLFTFVTQKKASESHQWANIIGEPRSAQKKAVRPTPRHQTKQKQQGYILVLEMYSVG
jgi:hypothetical protein